MGRRADQTRFFGREDALQRLEGWRGSTSRLLTLVGSGGIGKTRLATQFGRLSLVADEVDSVVFCDCSEARTKEELIGLLARALAVPPNATDLGAEVERTLAVRTALLFIVDNVEQLIAEARDVIARWVDAGLAARVLVTSREVLGLPGEERIELGPLEEEDATLLLEDRVRTARSGDELQREEREVVRAIVRRLDGIPLALELCASCAEVLSLQEIEARLDRRFDLLRDERSRDPRHSALEVAIAWSWDRLTEDEQRGLAQCAAFRGGFSIDAAEAVIRVGDDARAAATAVAIVQSLRRKSLLHGGARGDKSRLGLYESIRLFAANRLFGEAREAALARHAAHFAGVAARLETARGRDEEQLVEALEHDRDNLAAALATSLPRDPRAVAQLTLALDRVHADRGPWKARPALLDAAVDAATRANDDALRARALERRGFGAVARGDLASALVDLDAASKQAAACGAIAVESAARRGLAHVHWRRNDREDSQKQADLALKLARTARDRSLEALALRELGDVQRVLDRGDEAETLLLRALEIHREIGARRDEATCLMRLAALFGNRRDVHRARDVLLEAHALHRELGNTAQEAQSLRLLALATHELGELDVAVQLIEESLAMLQRTGDRSGEIAVLRMFAMLLLEIDRDDEALASARSALALCKRFDSPRIAIDVLISLACVHLCAARDDAADDVLSQAAELAVSISDDEGEGEALAFRAVVFAARGEIDAAKEAFRAARARLDGRMDRSHLPTVEVLEGALDDDGGLARIAKLRQRGPSDSSTVRVAMRLLEARRARKKAAPTAPAPNTPFEIEASGRWFRAPGATRVSLARRPSLARLLAALLRNSLETPGEGAPWETLFAEGWPGERVQRQAGKNRVQVAIRTLRREGLEPVLLTVEGAYLLDAARAKQAG